MKTTRLLKILKNKNLLIIKIKSIKTLYNKKKYFRNKKNFWKRSSLNIL